MFPSIKSLRGKFSIASFIFILSSALAEPSGQNLSQPIYLSSANNATLEGAIDTRFSVEGRYSDVRIAPTSCFMNTVAYVADISNHGWNRAVHVSRHAQFTGYRNVEIDIETVTTADLSARFLIWALYLAISDMTIRRQFFAVEFNVKWKGNVIAWIRFQKPVDQTGDDAGPTTASSDSAGVNLTQGTRIIVSDPTAVAGIEAESGVSTITRSNITTKTVDNGDTQLNFVINYTPEAKTLTTFDVFMAILATMVENAISDANARIQPFQVSASGFNAEVAITSQFRRRPPFFVHRWVTEAMTQVPAFMLLRGRFAEVGFEIRIDGVTVGGGTLMQKPSVTTA